VRPVDVAVYVDFVVYVDVAVYVYVDVAVYVDVTVYVAGAGVFLLEGCVAVCCSVLQLRGLPSSSCSCRPPANSNLLLLQCALQARVFVLAVRAPRTICLSMRRRRRVAGTCLRSCGACAENDLSINASASPPFAKARAIVMFSESGCCSDVRVRY